MPGGDNGGILIIMALGPVGGILGRFIGRVLSNNRHGHLLGHPHVADRPPGAVIVLAVYRAVTGRKIRS